MLIQGDNNDNTLLGTPANDTLAGLGGNDRLNGKNGNDLLKGGAGNDTLEGDGFDSLSAALKSQEVTIPSTSQLLAISAEIPAAPSGPTILRGTVSRGAVAASNVNIVYVVDVSGSMDNGFSGSTSVPDENGDGRNNTLLDAAIQAYRRLNQSLITAGQSGARVRLVAFDSSAAVEFEGTVGQDLNANSTPDVEEKLASLNDKGGTNFRAALQSAREFLQASPKGANYVYFMSDGQSNEGGSFTNEVAQLIDPAGLNADIRAFGLGNSADMTQIDLVDDGSSTNNSGIRILDPSTFADTIIAPPVNQSEIARVEILKNGTLFQTILAADLVSTPLGLTFQRDLGGLLASDVITTRVFATDPANTLASVDLALDGAASAGSDTLVGGDGNDLLDAGAGNDLLLGDGPYQLGAANASGTVTIPSTSQSLSISASIPTDDADQPLFVEGTVSRSAVAASNVNLVYVVDVSSSMLDPFTGAATVPDANGDGSSNTLLDAAIQAYRRLNQSLITAGQSGARVRLVAFNGSAAVKFDGTAGEDLDADSTPDVEERISALEATGNTNFEAALQSARDFLQASPQGANYVYFMSDGEPTAGSGFSDEVAQLIDSAGLNADIRAFGLGKEADMAQIDLVDDGKTNSSGIRILDPSAFADTIVAPPVSQSEISRVDIYKNDALFQSIPAASLVSTPLGLTFRSNGLSGLTPADEISVRVVANDPASTSADAMLDLTASVPSGNDTLLGGSGNDTLDGQQGDDFLSGGNGNDTYRFSTSTGALGAGDKFVTDSGGEDLFDARGSQIAANINLQIGAESQINGFRVLLDGNPSGGTTARPLDLMFSIDLSDSFKDDIGVVKTLGQDVVNKASALSPDVRFGLTSFVDKPIAPFGSGGDFVYREDAPIGGSADFLNRLGGLTIYGGDDLPESQIEALQQIFLRKDALGFRKDSAKAVLLLTDADFHKAGDGAAGGISTPNNGDAVVGGDGLGEDYPSVAQLAAALKDTGIFPIFAVTSNVTGVYDNLVGSLGTGRVVQLTSDSSNILQILEDVLPQVVFTVIENAIGTDWNDTLLGNDANNRMQGGIGNDTIAGYAGNDSLDGGAGEDTLDGGAGNDVLIGGAGIDELLGGAGNDLLRGGGSADYLYGGAGDDTYVVDIAGDIVWENSGEGVDLVRSEVSFSLPRHVENLELLGDAGSGSGNGLDNRITGSDSANLLEGEGGNDRLEGRGGNDRLDGGTGNDTMVGGAGDDTYVVDSASDVVLERSGEGRDRVVSGIDYSLASRPHLEDLALVGQAVIGTGNASANRITGNGLANRLDGRDGDDLLEGGAGADSMAGGSGNDTYVVDSADDRLTEKANEGTDTVRSSVTRTLGANFEDLELTGAGAINGTGNALANRLTGNAKANRLDGRDGNDWLDGGKGDDTLTGGLGNDTYVVNSTDDRLTEKANEGTDTVISSVTRILGANFENLELTGAGAINGTGNALANRLTGNAKANRLDGRDGNDSLDGGAGNDTMIGGLGNDTYVVDSADDRLTEKANEGTDTVLSSVTRTLGANFEDLELTGAGAINGTGNSLANRLTGNAKANRLSGRDGNDKLFGGAGNDTLDGGAGNDRLDGGLGADSFVGGLGNDTFLVDIASDKIAEEANAGKDTVISTVSRELGPNLENLVLVGVARINGLGNDQANEITGNGGNNSIDGRGGNDTLSGCVVGANGGRNEIDTLTGGAGNDLFQLGWSGGRFYDDGLAANAGRNDYVLITDFTAGQDKLQLDGAAKDYFLGASGVTGVAGSGLFHDSNANAKLDVTDELMAILRSPNSTQLTTANTIGAASFV